MKCLPNLPIDLKLDTCLYENMINLIYLIFFLPVDNNLFMTKYLEVPVLTKYFKRNVLFCDLISDLILVLYINFSPLQRSLPLTKYHN